MLTTLGWMNPYSRRRPGASRALLLGLVAGIALPNAHADAGDTLNWTAGINWIYDDNVFRLTPGANTQALLGTSQRSDIARIASFGGSFDHTYSRQRVRLDANLNSVDYQRFSFLNYRGGNITAEWDWVLSDRLTGVLSKYRTRSLSGFADLRTPVQNINTFDNLSLLLNWKIGADWMLGIGSRQSTSENSSNQSVTSNTEVDEHWALLRYLSPAGSSVTLRAGIQDGTTPNKQVVFGQLIDNSYRQRDVSAELFYPMNGLSSFTASLGQTERTHHELPSRNFSGATGGFNWNWQATGKTALLARARREIGAQADNLASYAVTDSVALVPSWAPTGKTMVSATFEQRKRSFQGDPISVLSFIPKREETTNITSLNLTYRPQRALALSLAVTHEQRKSKASIYYPSTDYNDNSVSLTAQLNF